ncbi:ArsR/SmtB family transcription factor [Pseudoalteromonas denitrificans]|jgi:ArsR family transcriptional regulator|uniref:ArsR family transcriptional regulator n=1 Tax=Pseudoalteromonas denitrificans DSM 6059 TaxID=1123010 RepID=A0A1I1LPV8_9GAMM|nr:metalloregulator ArsR/SmtB family transcription factor [Pseudoalteromonas denitrificans]SFC75257.1 ArsR family transcriptional regulator [Pseudoalteromonas denitrificans DSM 6059]
MLEKISQFYKTCSEPVRLRILNILLNNQKVCVCDLVSSLALQQSMISRHLTYLKNAEVVTVSRSGTWRYYEINNQLPADKLAVLDILKKQLVNDELCCADINQFKISCCE